jgi:hypothetical protein
MGLCLVELALFVLAPWVQGPRSFFFFTDGVWPAWLLPLYCFWFAWSSIVLLIITGVVSVRKKASAWRGRLLVWVGISTACVLTILLIVAFSSKYSILWGLWASVAVHVLLVLVLGFPFVRQFLAERRRDAGTETTEG